MPLLAGLDTEIEPEALRLLVGILHHLDQRMNARSAIRIGRGQRLLSPPPLPTSPIPQVDSMRVPRRQVIQPIRVARTVERTQRTPPSTPTSRPEAIRRPQGRHGTPKRRDLAELRVARNTGRASELVPNPPPLPLFGRRGARETRRCGLVRPWAPEVPGGVPSPGFIGSHSDRAAPSDISPGLAGSLFRLGWRILISPIGPSPGRGACTTCGRSPGRSSRLGGTARCARPAGPWCLRR